MLPGTTNATQLTRFLDPAAEVRVRLAARIAALGLDPEAFPSLPRMTKGELEHWYVALEQAGLGESPNTRPAPVAGTADVH